MPHRPIIYSQEQGRSFDILNGWKDFLVGMGGLTQALFGNQSTYLNGLSMTQQASPNMTTSMASGQIFQLAATDTNAWGALASDSTQIMQQGVSASQTLSFTTAGLAGGQSQWVLVQASFVQTDVIRTADPTGGVLAYFNAANPTQPLQGTGGSGATQTTQRQGVCQVSLLYGTPAASGSQVPPSASANNVGMYLVLLTFGQTQIVNSNIYIAGPSVGVGVPGNYPQAPFLAGLLNQHHKGLAGQAPQIDLTAEVKNILPLANLPASNTVGTIPTMRFGVVNPNSNLAGNIYDFYFNTAAGLLYECTTTGNAAAAVWAQIGLSGIAQYTSTFPFTVQGGFVYQCDTITTAASTQLSTAASYGGAPCSFINIGSAELSISPATGESIQGLSANTAVQLNPGDGLRLVPKMGGTGSNWYIAP